MEDYLRRRHAVMIASQLPADPEEAEKVLELCKELVATFLRPRIAPRTAQDRAVLTFPGTGAG